LVNDQACLACQTIVGTIQVPGGVIAENHYWLADHCLGSFGIGSIVVKTKAHRENLWDLTTEEADSLGNFLKTVSMGMVEALGAERVYVSLWVDQLPHHVHFVLQPRYGAGVEAGLKGWKLQVFRLLQEKQPDSKQAATAATQVRDFLVSHAQLATVAE
jgi:diadenosine tetraphosphate (Ap4A) HIT family hydrolase